MNHWHNSKMKKSLHQIAVKSTSHGVGQKRVLLSKEETESSLTQIAVTTLLAGEVAELHHHATMEECFFFLRGVAKLTVNGEAMECRDGDFVQVKCMESHKLEAVTDIDVMTIGVAIYEETTKYKVER